MKTEKELKEEIERIDNLKKDMSDGCWLSSQIRINKIKAEAKLKTLQDRNAEVKQAIEKDLHQLELAKTCKGVNKKEVNAQQYVLKKLLQELGLGK